MNSRQGFKCSTVSQEAMLWSISSDVPKKDKGKNRFPKRWNQGPWRSTDKEILPVNRIKAKLRNCPICLAELWDWKEPLRTTLWYPFSLFLKGVFIAAILSLFHHCIRNVRIRNRELVFSVHTWQQLDWSYPALGKGLCLPEMQDSALNAVTRRYYGRKIEMDIWLHRKGICVTDWLEAHQSCSVL